MDAIRRRPSHLSRLIAVLIITTTGIQFQEKCYETSLRKCKKKIVIFRIMEIA